MDISQKSNRKRKNPMKFNTAKTNVFQYQEKRKNFGSNQIAPDYLPKMRFVAWGIISLYHYLGEDFNNH